MKMSDQYSGSYLKAADLPTPRVFTIQTVTLAKMPDGTEKPAIVFVGEQQQLLCNKTNANVLIGLYGDDTAGWAGKPVELYGTTTDFQGRVTPCIRVRQPQEQPPWAGQQVQQPAVVQPVPQQVYQQMQPPVVQQMQPMPQQPVVQQQPVAQQTVAPIQAPPPAYPLDA